MNERGTEHGMVSDPAVSTFAHAPRHPTPDTRAQPSAGPRRPLPRLRPYQELARRAIVESVHAGKGLTFSVMVSRQGGKNELSAQLELVLLMAHMGRDVDAVKCAPTFLPQGLVSLRRLWARVQTLHPGPLAGIENGNRVRFGRARQIFLSAEPAANVAGHTAHLLLEVDEAQDVDAEKFDKDFRPMASTTNATTVYYGTAWSETDLLAEVRRRHLELERKDGIRRHFEFDWETVARHNPAYAGFVAAERDRLGEDHPLFVTQYLLRPLPGGGRLLSPAQRTLLAGTHARLHAPQPSEEHGRVLGYVAGLDVGGEAMGNGQWATSNEQRAAASRQPKALSSPGGETGGHSPDWTVLTIARVVANDRPSTDPSPPLHVPASRGSSITRDPLPGPLLPTAYCLLPLVEVVEHVAWQGAGHAEIAGGLLRLLREVWRVRRVVIDATGVGEGLASMLAAGLGEPYQARNVERGTRSRDGGPDAGSSLFRAPRSALRAELVRLRLTEERKSNLGYGLLAAVNSGRLRLYRQDGSVEGRALWRELELARAEYRPNRRLAWHVDPADGHDDFVMSLALAVEAARDLQPRAAKGREP